MSSGTKIRGFDDVLLKAIRATTGVLLAIMFVVIIFGVFFRYVLNSPAFWTEELARYIMFYMVLIGSASAIREERHPALTFVTDRFSRRFRTKWRFVLEALVFLVLAVVFWQGIVMAVEERIGLTAALRVSFFWVYLALPVGSLLMMFEIVAKHIWGKRTFDEDSGNTAGLEGE